MDEKDETSMRGRRQRDDDGVHGDAAVVDVRTPRDQDGETTSLFHTMPPESTRRTNTERVARYFERNQTVEVLPRAYAASATTPTSRTAAMTPTTTNHKTSLFRTYTSSVPLNSGGGLRQRLLDEEEEATQPPSSGGGSMATVTATRAIPARRTGELRRTPSWSSMALGRPTTTSWRVFYRNLPRALRFRQNTRSTTRYMDPANAASLRERVRAQREEASRVERGETIEGEAVSDAQQQQQQQRGYPVRPPGLERQRSNFEDVAKYAMQPSPPMNGSLPDVITPTVTTRGSSVRVDSTSEEATGRQSLSHPAPGGRTSSIFSLDSTHHGGNRKAMHRVVQINPDTHHHSQVMLESEVVEGESATVFPSNEVKTSQYSWWSFVPVFLYLTFQKTANLYFLFIGIFQMIPDISPTNGVPLQFLPLSIVTIIDAVFAAFEDYKRHLADHQANSAPTRVFNHQLREFEDVEWRDVCVGDFVKICNHETIPADVLILSVIPAEGTRSGGNAGICYVETKNLDGETNLKLREAPRATRHMFDAEEDAGDALQGYLESELPNGDINRYSGTLYIHENEAFVKHQPSDGQKEDDDDEGRIGIPVTLKNMLLRGSKLRNTAWAYGLVVNTGVDSKIMKSSGDEFPVKLSSIDEMTNKQVIIVVVILVLMSMIGAIMDNTWLGNLVLPSFIDSDEIPKSIIGTFVYFFTTLASMVPITLYVSITMVKALQAYFMERDLDLYDAENDVRMLARNMQLNEQLGQISHIFSDKTGTLTCNKMEFRKCSIHGVSYGKGTTAIGLAAMLRSDFKGNTASHTSGDADSDEEDEYFQCPAPNVNFKDRRLWQDLKAGDMKKEKIRAFFTHLALCHGVLIERLDAQAEDMEVPPIVYSASSPDEQALVSGAKYFGFEFVHREPGSVSVKTPEGVVDQYEILEVFEFDSTRKRMTVVVQKRKSDQELMQMTENDDEEVLVLTKGADSVLFPRLADSETNRNIREPTLDQLEAFARDGLRTLVICSKVMPLKTWESFHMRYRRACSDLQQVELKTKGEKNEIDELQDEMEQDLDLLGATAIEDRLQDGVPETMESLAKAGISIWVLTGDMEETAINIGYACRLLNNDMQRHVINASNYHSKGAILRQLDKIFHWIYEGKPIDGDDGEVPSGPDRSVDHALVIDGASLGLVLEDPLNNLHLLRVALLCKVVVACRVSPQQKAQLVELVKLNIPDSHTLSIGDGANDVPMIQSAHIGIGISGQEGMQAVNSSDYALGQFRFLAPLLLTHGRWNYNRVAALTVYTFYKNIVYCVSMFYYCLKASAYSGTMIYSAFIQQGYNLFFTALPILVYAVFDRDLPKDVVMAYPALYHPGTRARTLFTYTMFWKWIGMAVLDSVGVYVVTLAASDNVMRDGEGVELTVLQSMAWTILCAVVNARFCLMVNTWSVLEVVSVLGSMATVYGFQHAVDMITWTSPDYDTYSFPWLFYRSQFWLGQLLAVVGILAKNFFYEGYRRRFHPDYLDLVKEKLYLTDKPMNIESGDDGDDLKKYQPPSTSTAFLSHELAQLLDYRERRVQDRAPVRFAPPGRAQLYRGFAFDQPAYIVNWILSTTAGNASRGGPLRRKSMNVDVRQAILNSNDPVIFENERYQPFCGFGSTYPGYLLPTDRSRWSDRSGKVSAMAIPLAGLELDLDVPGCDEDGWVYEKDFKFFSSVPPPRKPDEELHVGDVNIEERVGGDEAPRSRPGSRKQPPGSNVSTSNSRRGGNPLKGLVRRRQWVLSEKYKALAREQELRDQERDAAEQEEKEHEPIPMLLNDPQSTANL